MRTLLFSILLVLSVSCGEGNKKPTANSNANSESSAKKLDPLVDGKKIFDTYCVACHGQDGKLQLNGAKDLSISELSRDEKIKQVTEGKGLMTPYNDILSPEEIEAVVDYTLELVQ